MDVHIPLLSRRTGSLENGTVVVACGLPVAMLSTGESSTVTADLITVVVGIASVLGLVLLQVRIGLFHVGSGDIASVALLMAGIAAWAIAVLFAASGGPTISLFLTAVSAALLLSALRRLAGPTVDGAAS